MENAVEALKIAFAVMMFVMALTLSMSSFSQATEAISSIIKMSDRETEYTYVEPSDNLTRAVGIETIVPSMYRAYTQNIEIRFYINNGAITEPLVLYYKTDNNDKRVEDENGNPIGINYIDLSLEKFATAEEAANHLDIILGADMYTYDDKYKNQLIYQNGFYKYLSELQQQKYVAIEQLGEYYQGTGTTKIKKRVITYTLEKTI